MFGNNRNTRVGIEGDKFTINGSPTLEGKEYKGHSIEGLLFNARMVQAIFDDENPETRGIFAYPDTGEFNPDRNVTEFVRSIPEWQGDRITPRLQAVSINFQGGRPVRAAPRQPWLVSGFQSDGSLKREWLDRLEVVLTRADQFGMVVILGYFYFGQEDVFEDEEAIFRGAENLTEWLLDNEFTNVLIEVNNECDIVYDQDIFRPERVDELIEHIQSCQREGFKYNVGVSFSGGNIPTDNVINASDYLILHGNSVKDPARIAEMVDETRARPSYVDEPIVFNEDPHFNFEREPNHFFAALSRHASWGYFDPGINNYENGYQCPPVEWGINTERQKAFFDYLDRIVHGQ